MGLVKVLVVELNEFNALILFQSGEFFELLSEQVNSKLDGRIHIIIVEVLNILDVSFHSNEVVIGSI